MPVNEALLTTLTAMNGAANPTMYPCWLNRPSGDFST